MRKVHFISVTEPLVLDLASNKVFSEYQNKKEEDIMGKTDYDLFSFHDTDKFRHDDERGQQ